MKKNSLLIISGIVLLLLVAGGSYFVMSKKTSPAGSPQVPSIDADSDEGSIQSSLKDLLAKGIAQKCTFSDKLEGSDISGVMYMANSRMRGDFNSVISDKTLTSHMILKDNTSYTWQAGENSGYMMKNDPEKTAETNEETPEQAFDPDKVVDYKCSAWIVDNSLFDPPSDVKFSDFSSMMEKPTGQTPGKTTPDACSTCDNLSGEAKSQCLSVFKC